MAFSKLVEVFGNSVSATYLDANPVFHAYTEHIGIDFHFIQKHRVI